MAEEVLFDLPNDPEEFGVILDPPALRRIDYSALEYPEIRRALIEYIKTYYPDQFNDFSSNNGIIMILELVSYVGDLLSQRSDIIADEAFLPTAQTEAAVDQHLFLINNRINRATPATVDIEVSLGTEAPTAVRIPAGLIFTVVGSDGLPVNYEIYRAPNDFTSDIVIFPGDRGTIAFGIEGKFATPIVAESAGGGNQEIEILDDNVLEEPIIVEVATGSNVKTWTQVDTLESAEARDEVYEVIFSDDRTIVKFGNDVTGKAPLAGQVVTVRYRVGGGRRGRIIANTINETRPVNPDPPATAPIQVLFRNIVASSGGQNKESLDQAKKRAPKESASAGGVTSGEDYSTRAKNFNHPIYGSVLKAVATVRTSLNANVVEVYVLAAGPDDIPVLPSLGLKSGLVTFFEDVNVLTDEVRVLDAAIKPVDIDMTVVISRNADPSVIRTQIDNAISDFFDQTNFELGQPFYKSQLNNIIQSIDGVSSLRIFDPPDDIIQSNKIAGDTPDNQVGFNELITLGALRVKIFANKASI